MLAVLRPHERVLVLLQLLGGERPVEIARGAVEAVESDFSRIFKLELSPVGA